MPQEIIIVTNGTPSTTTIYMDGNKVEDVQSIEFKSNTLDIFNTINIGYAVHSQCSLDSSKINVSDSDAICMDKGLRTGILTRLKQIARTKIK